MLQKRELLVQLGVVVRVRAAAALVRVCLCYLGWLCVCAMPLRWFVFFSLNVTVLVSPSF